MDIDPEVCQHLACPAVRLPHIHGAEFRLDFPSQEQVLRDRQIRNQDDLLMYDSDSFLLGVRNTIYLNFLTINLDCPAVRFINSSKDLDKR